MASPLVFEHPTSIQYFALLVAQDDGLALLEAAVSVAQDEHPDLAPQDVLLEIDALVGRLKHRIADDAAPLQRLRLLNRYFFRELGFAGNVNNYYDARNSYIHEVLRTRRGIPISLALVYMDMAAQLGLSAAGVNFPGHFLVKLRMPRGEVIIDPFSGQSLSRDELDERLAPFRQHRQHRGVADDRDAPLSLYLQDAPPREVLARLLRNLKEIHRSQCDWPRLLAVQERLVVLLPEAWEEVRDRGLLKAELCQWLAAAVDFAAYLLHRPHAADAAAVQQRLRDAQERGSAGLH